MILYYETCISKQRNVFLFSDCF